MNRAIAHSVLMRRGLALLIALFVLVPAALPSSRR